MTYSMDDPLSCYFSWSLFFQNFDVSENPTVCTDCWEVLQTSFSFKKNYLEVEKRILFYCTKFDLQQEDINSEILEKIHMYFSNNNFDPTPPQFRKTRQNIKTEAVAHSTRIVMEHDYINPFNEKGCLGNMFLFGSFMIKIKLNNIFLAIKTNQGRHKRLHMFTDEEDRMLISAYFFVTENEKKYYKGLVKLNFLTLQHILLVYKSFHGI